jgi:hypothetical protein
MSTPYISWLGHGAANLAPPGVFTGATAHAFGIDASASAMQSLADRLLNPAGGGVVRYEAALPVAMLTFMDIAQCTSGVDIVGWLPGRECALWVPLLEYRSDDPLPSRLVFWSPYIFISYTIGMVTGREVWGWPKVLADISVPGDNPAASAFTCATTYFPTLAATTQGVTGPLLQVIGPSPTRPSSVWSTADEAADGLIGLFLGGLAEVLVNDLRFQPQVPSVALKQFRQAGAASLACYQAICDSPIEVTTFTGGGPLFETFSLQITTCESHPIVADLTGQTPDPGVTTLPVKFAAWLEMDFQALTGGDVVVNDSAA